MGNVCAKDNTDQAHQDAPVNEGAKMKVAAAHESSGPEPVRPVPVPAAPAQAQPQPQLAPPSRDPVQQSPAPTKDEKPVEEVKLPEDSHVSDFEETSKLNPMAPEVQKVSAKFPPKALAATPLAKECAGLPHKILRHKVTGDTYSGTVERGVPHGWGYFVTKKGEFIEGRFVEGKLQDSAVRQITIDGTYYEGGFNADHKRHGKGIVICPKNVKTESTSWVNGQLIGDYTETDLTSNRVIFKGSRNDKGYHGPCTWTGNDHTVTGTWKDGALTGQGRKVWNDGRVYEGVLDKDRIEEGQGTITFVDGRKWTGPFSKGQPNGDGTFTNDAGKSSKQTWKNGRRV